MTDIARLPQLDQVQTNKNKLPEHLADQSVSVIIATRDRPELLRRAITGVAKQNYSHDLEVIVVFDRCEPDHSLVHDCDVRVMVTTNLRSPGLAGARNCGISKASNNWIAFCDDDDEWLPGKLAAQFDALTENSAARAACTGIFVHYQDKDTPRIPSASKLSFDGFLKDRMTEVHPSSWLVHAPTLRDQIGFVDEELPGSYAEDYDLFLRTALQAPIAVAGEPLVRVWWHGSSFFFERWKTVDEALEYLVNKYPEFNLQPEGLARIRGQQAVAKAAMGDRRAALKQTWETFRLNKTEKRVPIALLVATGIPAKQILNAAHRLGRGI